MICLEEWRLGEGRETCDNFGVEVAWRILQVDDLGSDEVSDTISDYCVVRTLKRADGDERGGLTHS